MFVRIRVTCLALSLFTLGVLSASPASAGDQIPWSTDIEASLKQAAETGRPVLMEFTASWW
ncbi:MAG: hypothetical protein KDA85_15235, partial [Planctomycetaceae bacterium]|nr:hypothetical protein [Planctomycetaceae bacterium]